MTIEIPLTQGQIALIDDDKYELISQYKWCAKWNKGLQGYYAGTAVYKSDGSQTTLLMHRLILGLEFGNKLQVDHFNHNTLDNRLENISIKTHHENMKNKKRYRNGTSKYKGIYWDKQVGKWRTLIKINGVLKHLGYFKIEEEAARAYDKEARKHGVVILNFPEE